MTQQHEPQAAVSAPRVAPVSVPGERAPEERERLAHTVQRSMVGLDHASIMGVELMAAILVWTGVGFLLDRWLGTGPWLLVAGGILGNAAGIYLIWIRSGHMEAAERRADADRREAAAQRHAAQRHAARPTVARRTPVDRHDAGQLLLEATPEGSIGER